MFGDNHLPDLDASTKDRIHELVIAPLWFIATMIQGSTAIYIDSRRNIHFKKAHIIDEPTVKGAVIDGMFYPGDGAGSFVQLWNTTFVLVFEDVEALLNPSTMEVTDDEIAVDEPTTDVEVFVPQYSSRSLRAMLAAPFWFFALLYHGATCIQITEQGSLEFKRMRKIEEPEPGVMVGHEFKKLAGPGSLFTRWATSVAFSIEGLEALYNPAMAEVLRAKDEAELAGEIVGAGSDESTGVLARSYTAINCGRLAEYVPFAMMDGTATRQQMNIAYEATSKFRDNSGIGRWMLVIIAFMLGAMSPRLNGTAGGGGGGGGGGAGVPMPAFYPPVDQLAAASRLAVDAVGLGVV